MSVVKAIQRVISRGRTKKVVKVGNSVGITLDPNRVDEGDRIFMEDTDDPCVKKLHFPRNGDPPQLDD